MNHSKRLEAVGSILKTYQKLLSIVRRSWMFWNLDHRTIIVLKSLWDWVLKHRRLETANVYSCNCSSQRSKDIFTFLEPRVTEGLEKQVLGSIARGTLDLRVWKSASKFASKGKGIRVSRRDFGGVCSWWIVWKEIGRGEGVFSSSNESEADSRTAEHRRETDWLKYNQVSTESAAACNNSNPFVRQ